MNNHNKKLMHGFTLIELLVVIAIIGILATVVMLSVSRSRSKANDANRKSNVDSMTKAVQAYNTDNGSYLVSTTDPTCSTLNKLAERIATTSCSGQKIVANGILSTIPEDPAWTDENKNYVYKSDGHTFTIEAKLSNEEFFQRSQTGSTETATSITSITCAPYDINQDGVVGDADYTIMQSCWFVSDFTQRPECKICDLNNSESINIQDYAILRAHWGEQTCQ